MKILAGSILLLLTACLPLSAPFHLHPVGGSASPAPIPCRFKIHFGWQTATITAELGDGERYSADFGTRPDPPDREMAPLWDQVFGAGYFNSRVLGSPQHFRAVAHNAQNQELRIELHRIPGDNHGGLEGVAIDSRRQVYKAGY